MVNGVLQFRVIVLFSAAALFFLSCAVTVPEKEVGIRESGTGDEEFVGAIKQQIDYEVTESDAIDSIDTVRGKIVKWHGNVHKIWDDKIHILGPGEKRRYNFFVFLLDHPLPRETGIGDMTQSISPGDAIVIIGRIVDLDDVMAEIRYRITEPVVSPAKVTAPILKGYVISKDNDRNFEDPVWVGHR